MRKIRVVSQTLPAVALAATLVAASPSPAQTAAEPATAEPTEIFPLDEIRRGQKGYGISVFAGERPERFEFEVLGVIRNNTPELSYVLATVSGQGLERSGIAGGMSGSPVYIDGRLVGAVAFSYAFSLDPIAGITPIEGMRRLSKLAPATPAASARSSSARSSVELEDLLRHRMPEDLLERQLALLSPPASFQGSSAVVWSAAGFGERSLDLLRRNVSALSPLGGGGAPSAGELEPGSAVSVILMQGDLSLAAHGTVTDRSGDEILAMGHPLFGLGPAVMPMGTSEVITTVANRANSFKLSNAGQIVGAFDQDRQAGIRGRLGAEAPTIPLEVRLRGMVERDYSMRIADIPQLTPILLAVGALGALDAGSYSSGDQALDVRFRFELEDYGPLEIAQSFDGIQAAVDSISYMLGFSNYLAQNPLENVQIEAVEVEFTQLAQPQTATLAAAFAERRRVEPGAKVPVVLEFQAYRGERFRRELEVELPEDLPEGSYYLLVGDGTSMDAARLQIEKSTPETFEQSLRMLRSLDSRRELRIFGLRSAPGFAVAGEVLPELPPSLRQVFAQSGSQAGTPLGLVIDHEESQTLDVPLQGVLRIDLEIYHPTS